MPTLEHNPMAGQELTPEEYIRENFEPSDRIAVLVLNRDSGRRVQRIVPAHALATDSGSAGCELKTRMGQISTFRRMRCATTLVIARKKTLPPFGTFTSTSIRTERNRLP